MNCAAKVAADGSVAPADQSESYLAPIGSKFP